MFINLIYCLIYLTFKECKVSKLDLKILLKVYLFDSVLSINFVFTVCICADGEPLN